MLSTKRKFQTVDEYISTFPKDVQVILEKIRTVIKNAAPEAEEAISYQIPVFKLNGNLIHYAAWKNHIALYPAPRGHETFKKELSVYKGGKGTVQFPLDKPIPLGLIKKITKFRVKENLERVKKKKK